MKNFVVSIGVIISMLLVGISVCAEDVPTAKVTATLVGDKIPVTGEKFTIAINVNEISSNLFVGGEVILNWPAEVVSLADSYYEEAVIVTDDYCLGNIYNQKIGRAGKFEYISNFDRASMGRAAVAIYISLSSGNQDADIVSNLTMFEISFVLNEGYTYDDFYFNIVDSVAFLTADKQTVSRYKDGKIELTGIGDIEINNIDNNSTETTVYLLRTIEQTNDESRNYLNVEINLLYKEEYNEAVLIKNRIFKTDISVTNLGLEEANVICYIAEYNSDNSLIGFTRSNTITVSPESMVTENIEYSFADDAVKAKVFCWKNGALMPIGRDIVLTADATDYYADTYTEANNVELNKQICGEINVSNDVDIVKIITTEAGNYIVKFSADNTTSYVLIDSENNVINATTDGNYTMYNLQGNSTYYLKMTGNADDSYHIKPIMAENVIKNIASNGRLNDLYDCEIYQFIPEISGEYIITAVGTDGVKASLYDSNFEKISSSDTGDDYASFRIKYNMTANEKYYIVVEQKSNEAMSSSYELYVEEPFEIISIY